MTKYMTPFAGNQRTHSTAVSLSLSSATKAFGSCDVISRDPSSAAARPTTALPRYMQDTAVSRQRTFFFNRPSQGSRQPPKSARLSSDSENITQAKVDSGRNILRRSVTVVEGDTTAATKEGGLAGDLPLQGPTRTEPLDKISRSLHREVAVDAAEGPVLEKRGIVIEEVTVPLDLSSSAGQSIDQRPLPGRYGVSPNSPAYFLQHPESGIVRLPDISSSAASSLRRVSSELPFIGALSLQRERERRQEQPEVWSRDTSPIDYDLDSSPLPMGDHRRVGGPSTSGNEGPLKRSMPSTTTLSSGSSHNVLADSRRPSKIHLTDCVDMVPGGSTTTRQNDDVFLRPLPRKTSTREDRYPPSTLDTARVSVDRQSSMSHSRNGDTAKAPVSTHVSGLSEAALRILDEINIANDMTRIQNNLERFQRTTTRMAPATPRLSLQQGQGQGLQPAREKKNSWADAGGRQRRPPVAAAAVVVSGGKGLMRTSKSQPNLIRHQRLQQQQQQQLYQQQQQQSGVRNPVNGSRNARRAQPFKSEDLEDEVDDCDEEDERTETMKRERIVRWLIGANECAEPPPFPTVIEEERPSQTDNAIHIVYTGE